MALSVWIEKKLGAFQLNVSFETDGETLGILGASGCGKSVTLQCIAGTMRPDRGRIVLNGRVLFDSERRIDLPPQKRGVGYLFQQYALFPNMTVAQNIHAGVRTGTRAEKRAAVDAALCRFRLENAAKQYPETLSGGQQQRTALARILVGKPELLLLDEPFSALDSFLKGTLAWELSEALDAYRGDILFVSHDRDEVQRFCQSVAVLDDGRSEPVVPVESLLQRPRTVAAARLAGFRNLFDAERTADGLWLPALGLAVPAPAGDLPCDAVCIPDTALSLCGETTDGAIRCTQRGQLFEGGQKRLLLHPDGATPETLLCLFAADSPNAAKRPEYWVSINEKAILYLKNTRFIAQ